MQKHYGGVRGTILARGTCPHCRRSMAGGYSNRERTKLWLRPHKTDPRHPGSPWCQGGSEIVSVDRELMEAHARALRQAETRSRPGAAWPAAVPGADVRP